MSGKTITRADLVEVLREEVDLSRKECAALLESVLDEIAIVLLPSLALVRQTLHEWAKWIKNGGPARSPAGQDQSDVTHSRYAGF